ncbi:hypothetical protein RMATCC62417_14669 [Rhizopus microsporus]|nr:hypothetical protein RMATCC62417_14669 [Rhizopus microsporus]
MKLPENFRPGSDMLSENMLQYQYTIDIITSSLNLGNDTYVNAPSEFPDNTHCDTLLIPKSIRQSGLPPIAVEFQRKVIDDSMNRGVVYCTHIQKTSHFIHHLYQ